MSSELNATVTMSYAINHGLLVLQVTPDEALPALQGRSVHRARSARLRAAQSLRGTGGSARRPRQVHQARLLDRLVEPARPYFEFFLALVRTGALTPRLFALQPGDRIWLGSKIVGMFTLDDVQPGHDLVFVATGTGLAPYISMLRSRYAFDSTRKTVVVHAEPRELRPRLPHGTRGARRALPQPSLPAHHRQSRPRPYLGRRDRLCRQVLRQRYSRGPARPPTRPNHHLGVPVRESADGRGHEATAAGPRVSPCTAARRRVRSSSRSSGNDLARQTWLRSASSAGRRLQVRLVEQVRDPQQPQIVLEQGQRHDQRHQPSPVRLDLPEDPLASAAPKVPSS